MDANGFQKTIDCREEYSAVLHVVLGDGGRDAVRSLDRILHIRHLEHTYRQRDCLLRIK